MKVSAVLSIHNRSKLLRRALDGYLWQTMPPEDWEIILVDDGSSEDLRKAYSHLIGRINLRHVQMDHTRHPAFKRRNPEWDLCPTCKGPEIDHASDGGNYCKLCNTCIPKPPKDWFHTPALSINLGVSLAKGSTICLCHPEVLHAPTNFGAAHGRLQRERAYLIGTTYLGTESMNRMLDADPDWTRNNWNSFLRRTNAIDGDRHDGMYWFTSFLPKAAVEAVGGVDFSYLDGVAGEDDDFRERVDRAGWKYAHAKEIEGFHQDHTNDKDSWTFHAARDKDRFDAALNRNRALFFARMGQSRPEFGPSPCLGGFPQPANLGYDWTAKETLVSIEEHTIL